MERCFIFQEDIHSIAFFLKAFYRMAERQPDAMPAHLVMDKRSHIRIKRIHQLLWTLDNGDLHPQLPQILRQLQPDEAAACQHCRFGMVLIDVLLDSERILHCTQGK